MKYKYYEFINNSKKITDIKDIYIDKWYTFKNKKCNCTIDSNVIDLFNSDLNYKLLKIIFTSYRNLLIYKDCNYMFRPMYLDKQDSSHFLKMVNRFGCSNFKSLLFSLSNIEHKIKDNIISFFNFLDPSISNNLNKTIDILTFIFNLYHHDLNLQKQFYNKVFLFKINNIDYVLSKEFINQVCYKKVDDKMYLYTNGLLYE